MTRRFTTMTILLSLFILITNISIFAEAPFLTVDQAVKIALTENPTLKNSWREVEQARVGLQSYLDVFYPTVNLSSNLGVNYNFQDNQTSNSLIVTPRVIWQIDPRTILQFTPIQVNLLSEQFTHTEWNNITLNRVLYGGDNRWEAGMEARQFALLSREINHKEQQATISYQVIKDYYNVVKSIKMVEIQAKALKRSEDYLAKAQALYEANQIAKSELLTAQLQVAQEQVALNRAVDSVTLAKMQFNFLLGVPSANEYSFVADLQIPSVPWTVDEAISLAKANSAQIKIYEEQLKLKEVELRRIEKQRNPEVALTGGFRWSKDNINNAVGSVSLNVDLTPAINRKREYDSEEILIEIAKIEEQIKTVGFRIEMDIMSKYLRMAASQQDLAIQSELLEQIKTNLDIAMIRYQAGMTTGSEILDLQVSLLRSETNYYETAVGYKLTVTELLQLITEDLN